MYKIKAYNATPLSSKKSNFRMAKKNQVLLENAVNQIEWIPQNHQFIQ